MNLSFNWRDMLRFDKMIAPTFLTILYYIHVAVCVLTSIWFVGTGMSSSYGGGVMVMGGLAGLVLGPFLIRLLYELLIVIFQIHTRLASIDYTLHRTQPNLPHNAPQPDPAPASSARPAPVMPPSPVHLEAESAELAQPIPSPATRPVPDPASAELPTSSPAPASAMPNFWDASHISSPLNEPTAATTSVSPVDLTSLRRRVPNWPAALAALLVLYGVVSPYAVVGYNSAGSLGQLAGLTFAIKNSSLGVVALLATLVMLVCSAGGLKWLWFAGAYGLTVIGSLFAFLDENSVFSQLSKAKAALTGVGASFGTFAPQADQFAQQMADSVPSASQCLTLTFYLFVLAMLFLGYWVMAGTYRERGLLTGNHTPTD